MADFSLFDLVEALVRRRQAQNMRGDAEEAVTQTRRHVTGQDKPKRDSARARADAEAARIEARIRERRRKRQQEQQR